MSLFCVSQSIIARGLIKNSGVAIRDGISQNLHRTPRSRISRFVIDHKHRVKLANREIWSHARWIKWTSGSVLRKEVNLCVNCYYWTKAYPKTQVNLSSFNFSCFSVESPFCKLWKCNIDYLKYLENLKIQVNPSFFDSSYFSIKRPPFKSREPTPINTKFHLIS